MNAVCFSLTIGTLFLLILHMNFKHDSNNIVATATNIGLSLSMSAMSTFLIVAISALAISVFKLSFEGNSGIAGADLFLAAACLILQLCIYLYAKTML